MKYYVYHNPKHEYHETISSVKEIYGVDDVILLPEKSYLLRIPVMQNYEGHALVLSSSLLLKKEIDIQSFEFKGDLGITNKERTLFLIDCSCDYAKETLTNKRIVSNPMRNLDVQTLDFSIDSQLGDYVELKKNKNNNVFFGQAKDKET